MAASHFAPTATARFIGRQMLTPKRRGKRGSVLDGRVERVVVDEKEVVYRVWEGVGPTVVLVHGWEGRIESWSSVIPALKDAGARILAFDAPAHGESAGRTTDVHAFARSIEAVVAKNYKPDFVIGHSVGAVAATLYASKCAADCSNPPRLLLIAPAGDLKAELAQVSALLSLPQSCANQLERFFEFRYKRPIEQCSTRLDLMSAKLSALIIHDVYDSTVLVTASQRIAKEVPGVSLVETKGLGHFKILTDRSVVQRVLEYCAHA